MQVLISRLIWYLSDGKCAVDKCEIADRDRPSLVHFLQRDPVIRLFHYRPRRCRPECGAATEPHTCEDNGVKPRTSCLGSEVQRMRGRRRVAGRPGFGRSGPPSPMLRTVRPRSVIDDIGNPGCMRTRLRGAVSGCCLAAMFLELCIVIVLR